MEMRIVAGIRAAITAEARLFTLQSVRPPECWHHSPTDRCFQNLVATRQSTTKSCTTQSSGLPDPGLRMGPSFGRLCRFTGGDTLCWSATLRWQRACTARRPSTTNWTEGPISTSTGLDWVRRPPTARSMIVWNKCAPGPEVNMSPLIHLHVIYRHKPLFERSRCSSAAIVLIEIDADLCRARSS